MPYSQVEIAEYCRKIGRSRSTLFKWIQEGCDLRDPKSVREWQVRNEIRKTNIQRARERRRDKESVLPIAGKHTRECQGPAQTRLPANGDTLPPAGRKGAAGTLARLELAEERAHARLEAALANGDPIQIAACQDFWLKTSEVLRPLDLAVEVARRTEETQISLRQAEETVRAVADWTRISVMQFLSSEAKSIDRNSGRWRMETVRF